MACLPVYDASGAGDGTDGCDVRDLRTVICKGI